LKEKVPPQLLSEYQVRRSRASLRRHEHRGLSRTRRRTQRRAPLAQIQRRFDDLLRELTIAEFLQDKVAHATFTNPPARVRYI
jgi:hypothetical protein